VIPEIDLNLHYQFSLTKYKVIKWENVFSTGRNDANRYPYRKKKMNPVQSLPQTLSKIASKWIIDKT
jgi:hypothetical protein